MLAQVLLLSPPFKIFTYCLPHYLPLEAWQPGQRVIVPFGPGLRTGLLQGFDDGKDLDFEPKSVLWPLEHEPLLAPGYLTLVQEMARHLLTLPGKILSRILPQPLRTLKIYFVTPSVRCLKVAELASMESRGLEELGRAWMDKRMYPRLAAVQEVWYEVAKPPPWPLRPAARRQWQLLEYLWEEGAINKGYLVHVLGQWVPSVLKKLEQKGLVLPRLEEGIKTEQGQGRGFADLVPSKDQQRALKVLAARLESPGYELSLLHGVTGSGKTLIYLQLIDQCLHKGRSVLLLLPEVALAWQVWQEALLRLSGPCFFYHGYHSPVQRAKTFEQLARLPGPCLVVGTRSAVFVPRLDWGLIILDEEHDDSFKQDENLVYHVREVAYLLARQQAALLLLGSATPDLKTYFAATREELCLVEMTSRVGERSLPQVEIVDLLQVEQGEGPFARPSWEALTHCLGQDNQAIVLLNRRGYAPLVYCIHCGQVVRCEQCQVGLTYHKGRERLICHYCGQGKPFPLACPGCGSHEYLPLNQGTEQVEEVLEGLLGPGHDVLRLDRDTTRRQGDLEDILTRFAKGEAQVLVGTQMCSKGHNFPGVTLVIVLDGDLSMNLPDYRATERTFQLLLQVSGRAGRGDRPGRVLIQTRNPDHYCWHYLQHNDYQGFVKQELLRRKRLNYPPFSKLGMLRMSFPVSWPKGLEIVQEIGRGLKEKGQELGISVLGPAPAPLSRLRNRLRYHCLIKARCWADVRGLCRPVLEKRRDRRFRISMDLDPVQLL